MNRIPPACLTNANQDRKAHWKSCTPAIQKTMGLEREERKRALAASQRNNDPSMVTSTHSIGFHNTRGGHANDAYAHMHIKKGRHTPPTKDDMHVVYSHPNGKAMAVNMKLHNTTFLLQLIAIHAPHDDADLKLSSLYLLKKSRHPRKISSHTSLGILTRGF